MVVFRIGDVQLTTLEDDAFATVLEAAEQSGGASRFPALFGLCRADADLDPLSMMDELAQFANTKDGQHVAVLIGTLRDDLMTAVAAAGEG